MYIVTDMKKQYLLSIYIILDNIQLKREFKFSLENTDYGPLNFTIHIVLDIFWIMILIHQKSDIFSEFLNLCKCIFGKY